jgi:hypothetical protein
MTLSAYELVLVAGGFTVLGALISALVAHRLALKLTAVQAANALALDKNRFEQEAAAKLRAAFAPALAIIYLARHHGTHDVPNVDAFVKKELLNHASAIEEFRPFVANGQSISYQEAWEDYRKAARQDQFATTGEEWGTNAEPGELLEKKIHIILDFAKT